ncbi:hypothetical protein H4R99_000225 [Coemansia sp. RSA 1722]|nr:hypothetical protein IWW45_000132 [Coemansia sp. RSA 485]KAJ2606591.1 hypothetical protein H4R99_000225 [Coemansia sp. RSA 1722]
MIDTLPQYRIQAYWRRIARSVNLATALFFAVEWLLRLYSAQNAIKYGFNPLSVLDLLGIIPGFVYFTDDRANFLGRAKWLRALQVLRALRVLRLTEYSVELYVTIRTLRKSIFQILVVLMVIVIILLTACFLMFFAENDSLDMEKVQWLRKNHGVTEASPFQNVFFCFYWGLVTITTVGYGDYTPVSPWGQVIACVTMFMGVFTIVFPTSIISNNFSSEWDAFHKAQKLHEQRMLQQEYHHKRRDLERVWSYANRSYDPVSGRVQSDSPDTVNATMISERTSLHSNRNASDPNNETSDINLLNDSNQDSYDNDNDRGKRSAEDSQFSSHINSSEQRTSLGHRSSLVQEIGLESHHHFGRPGNRMAPFEYNRMINITKKVEENLGIPGVSLDQINTDSEVNQNLVVNAMYSKLYNDAFSNLCERMLAQLIELYRYKSVDQIAQSLEKMTQSTDSSDEGPHGKKLTMLEYKLLCFVFERLSQSKYPIPDLQPGDGSAKASGGIRQGKDQDQENEQDQEYKHIRYLHNLDDSASHEISRSSPNLVEFGRKTGSNAKQRIKSKLVNAYNHLPMTREQTTQSVHNFISSAIAQEDENRHTSKLRFHLHPRSKVNKEDISSPFPLRRSVSTGIVDPPTESVDTQDSSSSRNVHSRRQRNQHEHSSTPDSHVDVVNIYSSSENE